MKISAYTPSGEQLTNTQKELIISDFVEEGIKPPSDIMQFEDVEFIGMLFTVQLKVFS